MGHCLEEFYLFKSTFASLQAHGPSLLITSVFQPLGFVAFSGITFSVVIVKTALSVHPVSLSGSVCLFTINTIQELGKGPLPGGIVSTLFFTLPESARVMI